MGVLLKSYCPQTWAYAESFGLMRDPRRRLSVQVACGSRRSHRWMGKFGSVVHSPAIRWFLKVRMARSAALRR